MTTYIALLRGINVGGANKIKMADLKALLTQEGFEDVATLLQSGNVVFKGPTIERAHLEDRLEKATKSRFGIAPAYFVRTLREWEAIIEDNPFPKMAEKDPSHLQVHLLREAPDRSALKEVAARIEGPEELAAGSGHIYATYPDGIGTSKVDRTPGWKKLLGEGTARNWNTVLKLAALAKKS